MSTTPYHSFRFPKAIIQHAIWLHLRFTLSLRDVEELLAECRILVTYETVRVWVARFGPLIARRLRRRRGRSNGVWHLDEMLVKIAGRQIYLWRAVDSEGEVLDMLVQSRRDKSAALRLMRKLLKNQGMAPMELITDRLRAYGAAARNAASAPNLSRANGRTIGRRARTSRSACASGRCWASAHRARPNASSPPTLPPPTPSPPAVTSSPLPPIASSGPRPSPFGERLRSLRHRPTRHLAPAVPWCLPQLDDARSCSRSRAWCRCPGRCCRGRRPEGGLRRCRSLQSPRASRASGGAPRW
jgi:putative transposase